MSKTNFPQEAINNYVSNTREIKIRGNINKDIPNDKYDNELFIQSTPAILKPASKKAIEIIEKPKETRGNK